MPAIDEIKRLQDEMVSWRRDLHANPELGFAETRTSTFIQERLQSFAVDEIHTFTGTGVLAVIHGRNGDGGQAIGLRADIDALPIPEESGVPYASTNPGVMHACGHDGHTSMLLGAAKYLAASRRFKGTAYLIFQPAEEIGGGSQVVADGLFDRFPMQRIFGMHNMPTMPVGEFYWRNGNIMAAANFFEIRITGLGAHAAQPHFGIDPIVAGSSLVSALQTIVSRSVDPKHAAVVTVGSFQAGVAPNVIPREAVLKGTARWFDAGVGESIQRALVRLAKCTAESYGATAEVEMHMVARPRSTTRPPWPLLAKLQLLLRVKPEWSKWRTQSWARKISPTCSASSKAPTLCWGRIALGSSTRCCTTLVTISMTRSSPPAPPTGPPWSNSSLRPKALSNNKALTSRKKPS